MMALKSVQQQQHRGEEAQAQRHQQQRDHQVVHGVVVIALAIGDENMLLDQHQLHQAHRKHRQVEMGPDPGDAAAVEDEEDGDADRTENRPHQPIVVSDDDGPEAYPGDRQDGGEHRQQQPLAGVDVEQAGFHPLFQEVGLHVLGKTEENGASRQDQPDKGQRMPLPGEVLGGFIFTHGRC